VTNTATAIPDDDNAEPLPANPPRQVVDLEVVAIRFVDLGDAEKGTGPRFRLSVRNKGQEPVEAIPVVLMAGIDFQNPDLPTVQAEGSMERLAAGQTADVDVRLPRDAFELESDDAGEPVAFREVVAIADPLEFFEDLQPDDNVLLLSTTEIDAVELKVQGLSAQQLKAGETLVITGEGFGFSQGVVGIVIGNKPYVTEVLSWSSTQITVRVPRFVLVEPLDAQLIVVLADKQAARPHAIRLLAE
jgi:hypothetical protein